MFGTLGTLPEGGCGLHSLDSLPEYAKSTTVSGMSFTGPGRIIGTGDMWPMTWAEDDAIYAAAGDNSGFLGHLQTMNFWRIDGTPPDHQVSLVNDLAFLEGEGSDPEVHIIPIKPAGVVSVDGMLYMAVEDMRYTQGRFGNQINLQGWIIHSRDHGKTWDGVPRPGSAERRFLTGVFASPHFLQFGRDYSAAMDDFVYAYSSAGEDGVAAWSAGDVTYLARVPRRKILDRSAWEFYASVSHERQAWSKQLEDAQPVFRYPRKTGENEVVYHAGLGRFLLLNWAFIDCTNHSIGSLHSELSVFESDRPWGPWKTVHVRRDWGGNCDYQPRLPTKWINPKEKSAWLVSAGNFRWKGGRHRYGFGAVPVQFDTGDFGDMDPQPAGCKALGDFQVGPLSDSEIGLSWLPVRQAGYYRILRDGKKHKDIPPLYPARFIDQGLAAGECHQYAVQALSPAGDVLAESGLTTCTSLPQPNGNSLGLNLGSFGFSDGSTVWYGEESTTRFSVLAAGSYVDDRIATLKLSPDPGALLPALRSIRGEMAGVKVRFRGLSGKRVRMRLYVVDPGLCATPAGFEVILQGAVVARYKHGESAASNWMELGPFETEADREGTLLVEARHFTGLAGLAAIRIDT